MPRPIPCTPDDPQKVVDFHLDFITREAKSVLESGVEGTITTLKISVINVKWLPVHSKVWS